VHDGGVSLDLAVLAMDASADADQARAMAERCWRSAAHAEGEVDERIAAFYEELRTRFPPDSPDSPWMAALDVGIDHVIMNLSWSARSTPAIEVIQDLAAEHRLVIFDPQSQDAYLPGQ
jgi:hypothetical protein